MSPRQHKIIDNTGQKCQGQTQTMRDATAEPDLLFPEDEKEDQQHEE